MRTLRTIALSILLLNVTTAALAQETELNKVKKVQLKNGYEVMGKLLALTADSTILDVDGIRFAYHNSAVKGMTDVTSAESRKVAKVKKETGIDTLEISVKANVLTDQAFGSAPGYGGQLWVALPLLKNRLRIELGLGAQYLTLTEQVPTTFSMSFSDDLTTTTSAAFTLMPVTVDIGLSYDFLAKKRSSLSLYVGSTTLIPITKDYRFVDAFDETDGVISFEPGVSAFSGVKVGIDFALPVGKASFVTFGYSFSYLFGEMLPLAGTVVGGAYAPVITGREDVILSDDMRTRYEVTTQLGGLHALNIGYRHAISMKPKPKKKKEADNTAPAKDK
ncbi:MAG: hypothetical protein K9J06_15985 [Flavobacteriales bacterium]|nr:hypothetical protein [Flavobacteriales bacterium]